MDKDKVLCILLSRCLFLFILFQLRRVQRSLLFGVARVEVPWFSSKIRCEGRFPETWLPVFSILRCNRTFLKDFERSICFYVDRKQG
jgi:hypothetical protein